jgi:hypothetical protein
LCLMGTRLGTFAKLTTQRAPIGNIAPVTVIARHRSSQVWDDVAARSNNSALPTTSSTSCNDEGQPCCVDMPNTGHGAGPSAWRQTSAQETGHVTAAAVAAVPYADRRPGGWPYLRESRACRQDIDATGLSLAGPSPPRRSRSVSGGVRGQMRCTTCALIAWSRKSAGTSGHWGCHRADRWSARSSNSVAATYGPPSTR